MAKNDSMLDPTEFGVGAAAAAQEPPKRTAKRKMYKIFVDEEEGEPNFIKVGVNGKVYQIMRGVDVEVPEEVIEVLKNAIATRVIQTENPVTRMVETREQNYHRIPYRIVGM